MTPQEEEELKKEFEKVGKDRVPEKEFNEEEKRKLDFWEKIKKLFK